MSYSSKKWTFWAWSGLRSLNSDRFPMSGPSGTEGTIYKSHVTTVEFPPCTANPFGSSFGGSAGFSAAFFGAALFHRGGSGAAEDGAAASLWEQHNSLLQWQTEQIMCKAVLVNWALISNLRLCRWQMSQRLKHLIAIQSAFVSLRHSSKSQCRNNHIIKPVNWSFSLRDSHFLFCCGTAWAVCSVGRKAVLIATKQKVTLLQPQRAI